MAYIRKYRVGWRAEVQRHGQRLTHVEPTKRDAQQWAMRKEAELDAEAAEKKRGEPLSKAVERYLATVSPRKAESALTWERHRFDALVTFFGPQTLLADIDSDAVGRWRDARLKTVSGSTVRRESNLLRNLFTIAADEWRWLDRNPFRGVRMPKHNPARQATWGWRDIRRVLRAATEGEKTRQVQRAFRISLHTGLRLNEVLAAHVEGRVALLPKDKSTQDQVVKVPLTRMGAKVLAGAGPFTVGANEGSALFSRLLVKLGIEGLTFHDSRATALTLLARRVDVLTLARISRHRDLKILQNTYYRETPEQIADRLGRR